MTRTIANPLPCIRCNYELQGLPETAVCPECALPVCDSAGGLAPAARRALRRSLGVIVLASIWRPIAVLFAIVVLTAPNMRPPFTNPSLKVIAGLIALATVMGEWWAILTIPRSLTLHAPSWLLIAVGVCGCSIAAVAITAILGVSPATAYVGIATMPLLILIPAVVTLVLCSMISQRLLRDEGLARWCRVAAFAVPLLATVGLVFAGVGPIFAALIQFATVLGVYVKLNPKSSPALSPDAPASPHPTHDSSAPSPDPTRANPSTE